MAFIIVVNEQLLVGPAPVQTPLLLLVSEENPEFLSSYGQNP